MKARLILFLLLTVGVLGFLGWLNWQRRTAENVIEGSGTIETTEVEVGSRLGGRIVAVLRQEGDTVQEGEALVKLDPYQLPGQLEQLEAQRTQAQAQLAELIRGPRPEEIAAARAQYLQAQQQAQLVAAGTRTEEVAQAAAARRQAEADFQNAQANYQRYQALFQRHVISQQELDTATTTFRTAQERLNAARQRESELRAGSRPQEIAAAREQARAQLERYELLRQGTRPEEIEAQRALVKSIEAQITQLKATARELVVVSPCDCQISSMDLKAGQLILPNQTLATLINLNDLWVRIYIPEERFGQVRTGDKAQVRVDAFPQKTFQGKVVQLASRAEFTPRNVQTQETRRMQVFGVKVALNNRAGLLRPGMPADVRFDVVHAEPQVSQTP